MSKVLHDVMFGIEEDERKREESIVNGSLNVLIFSILHLFYALISSFLPSSSSIQT